MTKMVFKNIADIEIVTNQRLGFETIQVVGTNNEGED
jgi:hypothetical protein